MDYPNHRRTIDDSFLMNFFEPLPLDDARSFLSNESRSTGCFKLFSSTAVDRIKKYIEGHNRSEILTITRSTYFWLLGLWHQMLAYTVYGLTTSYDSSMTLTFESHGQVYVTKRTYRCPLAAHLFKQWISTKCIVIMLYLSSPRRTPVHRNGLKQNALYRKSECLKSHIITIKQKSFMRESQASLSDELKYLTLYNTYVVQYPIRVQYVWLADERLISSYMVNQLVVNPIDHIFYYR